MTIKSSYEWVKDSAEFESLSKQWLEAEYLAIDTEFERTRSFYPVLALVQIYDGKKVYLIDPQLIDCPDVFRQLCLDERVVKIFHSGKEDFEVLRYSWQCDFRSLFDTQIANAFLSGELSTGYAALVKQYSDVILDKQETRSNWLQRPLSEAQIHYAIDDVLYLPGLYQDLNKSLQDKSFNSYFSKECDELCTNDVRQYQDQEYRSVSEAWMLNEEQLGLFRQLHLWRYNTAVREDIPVGHIFRDPQLVRIALYQPESKAELSNIGNIHPRSIRRYWQNIVEQVKKHKHAPKKESTILNPRDISELNKVSADWLKIVKGKAESMGISENLLLSRRLIKKLAYSFLANEPAPAAWQGWRKELLAAELN
ncbi:MAG: HRDC domain-containing protein [Gammaproteobacteria bacterium]|nr:HRDC domain-containing protein [Gammaproteobacteria bacterium]